jgi:hypothetical protein
LIVRAIGQRYPQSKQPASARPRMRRAAEHRSIENYLTLSIHEMLQAESTCGLPFARQV